MYFVLTLNVGSFGSNIYITQVIFGAIEIPSFISSYILSQCLGRKVNQIGFLVLGGAACLSVLAIPEGSAKLYYAYCIPSIYALPHILPRNHGAVVLHN